MSEFQDVPDDVWRNHLSHTLVDASLASLALANKSLALAFAQSLRQRFHDAAFQRGGRYREVLRLCDAFVAVSNHLPLYGAPSGTRSWSRIDNTPLKLELQGLVNLNTNQHIYTVTYTSESSLMARNIAKNYFELLEVGDVVVNSDGKHHRIAEKSRYGCMQYLDDLHGTYGYIEDAYPSYIILIPPRTDLIV